MKRFEPEGKIDVVRFAGLAELVETAYCGKLSNESNRAHYEKIINRKAGRREDWPAGYDPARIKLEMVSPPACAAKVRDIAAAIELKNETTHKRRKMVYRKDDGDELNEDSWVRREPDGWTRTEKVSQSRNLIRIAVNVSINCNHGADDLFYRGAAAVALADALENAGNAVEIVLFSSIGDLYQKDGSRKTIMEIIAKNSHSPLDADTMALALGEIGFYRRAMLPAVLACSPHVATQYMGRAIPLPESYAQQFDILFDAGIYSYIDAMRVVEKYAAQFEAGPMSGRAG